MPPAGRGRLVLNSAEHSKAHAIQAVSVGGAWLGHTQHMLAANKCTSMPIEHTWFVKQVQGEGTTCMAKTWHKEMQVQSLGTWHTWEELALIHASQAGLLYARWENSNLSDHKKSRQNGHREARKTRVANVLSLSQQTCTSNAVSDPKPKNLR
jgi:hypothetical protein